MYNFLTLIIQENSVHVFPLNDNGIYIMIGNCHISDTILCLRRGKGMFYYHVCPQNTSCWWPSATVQNRFAVVFLIPISVRTFTIVDSHFHFIFLLPPWMPGNSSWLIYSSSGRIFRKRLCHAMAHPSTPLHFRVPCPFLYGVYFR